jgi:uncharacterized membrane protein YbhN (UPF0104 family)
MSRYTDLFKRLASAAIIVGVAFFFYRAFQRNWSEIEAAKLSLHYAPLLAASAFIVTCYLLSTWAWHLTINALSESRKLDYSESFATFNASALTKYLPGKVWSYALQMYWLGGAGFPKSLVVYANIVNLVVSLVTSLLAGLFCLLFASSRVPFPVVLAAFGALVLVDLALIKLYSRVFGLLISLLGRALKRDIRYFELSTKLMLELHVVYLGSALSAGASTYFAALGIGYAIAPADAPLLIASALISDVAGFLALVVPAGLGVREGLMYLMLNGASLGSLPLVLPVATRGMAMLADIGVGIVALQLLRTFTRERARTPGQ